MTINVTTGRARMMSILLLLVLVMLVIIVIQPMLLLMLLPLILSLFKEVHGGGSVSQAPPSDTSNSGCASDGLIFIFIFFATPITSFHRIVRFNSNAEL